MKTITVVVEGGMIQEIIGIPKGMRVESRDYDTEGADLDTVETDSRGRPYRVSVWSKSRE